MKTRHGRSRRRGGACRARRRGRACTRACSARRRAQGQTAGTGSALGITVTGAGVGQGGAGPGRVLVRRRDAGRRRPTTALTQEQRGGAEGDRRDQGRRGPGSRHPDATGLGLPALLARTARTSSATRRRNSVNAKVRDLAKVGAVVDAAVEGGREPGLRADACDLQAERLSTSRRSGRRSPTQGEGADDRRRRPACRSAGS